MAATCSAAAVLSLLIAGIASAETATSNVSIRFNQLARKAAQERDAGHLDQAISLYKKGLRLRPRWTEGWWFLGTSLYDQNSYAMAAQAFQKLLLLDPRNGSAHLFLGLCLFELGKDNRSLVHIERGKQLGILNDPQLRRVMLYHEGILLLRKGRFEAAQESLDALSKEGVFSQEAAFASGMSALRIRPASLPAGDDSFRSIVKAAGEAQGLAATKRFDDARNLYKRLLADHPSFPNLHYAFGRLLLKLHETDPAVAEFQKEIESNPQHALARLQIAAVKYRLDSAAGIRYAQDAVKLQPNLPMGHYLLGLLYSDTGKFALAIPELELAAKSFPKEPKIYFALGTAYARTGRKQEATRARATFNRLNALSRPEDNTEPNGENCSGMLSPQSDARNDSPPAVIPQR